MPNAGDEIDGRLVDLLRGVDVAVVVEAWAELCSAEPALQRAAGVAVEPALMAEVVRALELPQALADTDDVDIVTRLLDFAAARPVGVACRQLIVAGEAVSQHLRVAAGDAGAELEARVRILTARLVMVVMSRGLSLLDEQSRRDALTGLPNRRAFDEDIDRLVAESLDGGPAVVVVSLDLDGLKAANTAGGHAAGDQLIRRMAAHLADNVGPGSAAYRFAGDEFALLVTALGTEQVAELVTALAEPNDPAFSWGLARCPDEEASPNELWELADARMFEQKAIRKGGTGGTT